MSNSAQITGSSGTNLQFNVGLLYATGSGGGTFLAGTAPAFISSPSGTINIVLPAGSVVSTNFVSSSTYSITLKATSGQTLLTFPSVAGIGAFSAAVPASVTVASDGANGTLVTVACYTADSLIATPNGERVVSDLTVSYSGAGRKTRIGQRLRSAWISSSMASRRRRPWRTCFGPTCWQPVSAAGATASASLCQYPGKLAVSRSVWGGTARCWKSTSGDAPR